MVSFPCRKFWDYNPEFFLQPLTEPTMRSCCFLLFYLCALSSFAQTNKLIDSLEKITHQQSDTNLIKTYNELTWQCGIDVATGQAANWLFINQRPDTKDKKQTNYIRQLLF